MSRRTFVASLVTLFALPLAAVALAGCGGGNRSAGASPEPPKTKSGRVATVGVGDTGIGKILVDSKGRSLYLFEKDKGTKSECKGACAREWPPLHANGKPIVGSGLKASLVGMTTRPDGNRQVTYNSHPLYLFSGDNNVGETGGQGVDAFGALWYTLSPDGNQNTSGGAGGGGYGY